jgi:hypothetical protein
MWSKFQHRCGWYNVYAEHFIRKAEPYVVFALQGLKRHTKACEKIKVEYPDTQPDIENEIMAEDEYVLPSGKWIFIVCTSEYRYQNYNGDCFSGVAEEFVAREEEEVDEAHVTNNSQELNASDLQNDVDISNLKNLGISTFIQPGKCDCCGESVDTAHTVRRRTYDRF